MQYAKLAGISRAQLSRYLAGMPVPSDTLKRLAMISNVSTGWLLGESVSTQQDFRRYLILTRQMTERLHLQLQRTTLERAFTASELARVLELMILSQSHAVERAGEMLPYTDYDIHQGLHYTNQLCRQNMLDIYVEGCKMMAGLSEEDSYSDCFSKFSAVVTQSFQEFFSHEPMGVDYFERLNRTPVLPVGSAHAQMMEDWLQLLRQKFGSQKPIKLLDMGCGNGRHLVYLAPRGNFNLKGIDASPLGLKICREHEAKGILPNNTVIKADLFDTQQPPIHDAVMLITMGQFLTLNPEFGDYGFARLFSLAVSALKPKGLLLMLLREDGVEEFFPYFNVAHHNDKMRTLVEKHRLTVLKRQPIRLVAPKTKWVSFGRHVEHQQYWIIQKD